MIRVLAGVAGQGKQVYAFHGAGISGSNSDKLRSLLAADLRFRRAVAFFFAAPRWLGLSCSPSATSCA